MADTAPRSPLAPEAFPSLPAIAGVKMAVHETGLRYQGRPDLLVTLFDPGTVAAGVFTRSKTRSAPVDWCRKALETAGGAARALVVNAGNANAFTGSRGLASVVSTVEAAAALAYCSSDQVFIASTGTIGEPLDAGPIVAFLTEAADRAGSAGWEDAATAIMTTDTYPKGAGAVTEIAGQPVSIAGIAKGSGMIAPDMATMLSYVFTDAAIAPDVLQALLAKGVRDSFNAITVDGDTSTSDSLMLFATGKAGHDPITDLKDPRLKAFRKALDEVLRDLAHQVVKDGEGASKFVEIQVSGATSKSAARKIGLAVANSPLVKTAIAGEDANWGRIVMAVGKSGEEANRDRMRIAVGGVVIAEDGEAVPAYDEAPVAEHMRGQDIVIAVDVGIGGRGRDVVWTCDLTHGYISINADYRT
ncbi:MAG: bifunctional glutamate N-acetyltransferase/amino-acid acetyltransferase ArgJ [Rhodospirillaceae bacterium]